jgi:hypothetical protein
VLDGHQARVELREDLGAGRAEDADETAHGEPSARGGPPS